MLCCHRIREWLGVEGTSDISSSLQSIKCCNTAWNDQPMAWLTSKWINKAKQSYSVVCVWAFCTGFGSPMWDVDPIIQAGWHWGQVWRTALLMKGTEARQPFCSLSQFSASQITAILLCFPSIKTWWWANCQKRQFSVSLHSQAPDTTDISSCRNTATYSGLTEN